MQLPQCGQPCPPSCSGSACGLGLEGTIPPCMELRHFDTPPCPGAADGH